MPSDGAVPACLLWTRGGRAAQARRPLPLRNGHLSMSNQPASALHESVDLLQLFGAEALAQEPDLLGLSIAGCEAALISGRFELVVLTLAPALPTQAHP